MPNCLDVNSRLGEQFVLRLLAGGQEKMTRSSPSSMLAREGPYVGRLRSKAWSVGRA